MLLQNTKILQPSPRYKFISEKHILTLLVYELVKDDEGVYEIRVSNNAGTSRSTAKITLRQPSVPRPPSPPSEIAPEIVKPLKNEKVEEGHSVTLECTIKEPTGVLKL